MFTVFLDRSREVPLYTQLYDYIKTAIINDDLKANEKLPSKRKLSNHLKISVMTIENAYNQLMAEGYITSKPQSGFYVLPYIKLLKKDKVKSTKLESKPKETYVYDFKTNQIDSQSFPYDKWLKLEKEVLLDDYITYINETPTRGLLELRQSIATTLYEYRGISINPEQIIVGSGSEYLISLLVILLGRDNIFGVEEPGYIKNYHLYQDFGARVCSCELDDQGINLNKVGKSNILHVTPSHQFPLGIVTPIARRIETLNWAYKSKERYIIEDDYDSEFSFFGSPVPALKSLDVHDKVIYMNSFSKSISRSLRVSFMVLPENLLKKFNENYSYYTCTVPVLTQLVLSRFINSNEYEKHLNRMKNIYKSKRDYLIDLFKHSKLSDKIEIIGEEAGLHFLLKIHTETKAYILVEEAKRYSIRVYSIQEYKLNETIDKEPLIILGYSHLEKEDMEKAIKILDKIWTKLL